MADISIERVKQRLWADFETGTLFWRDCQDMSESWKARYAGRQALYGLNSHGYAAGKIDRKTITAHRVIWALYYGEWPINQIDHINGNRADNRISNLRMVSNAENARNQKVRRDSKTGIAGVKPHAASKGFAATIRVNGKEIWLGTFKSLEDAAEARRVAEIRYGFSGQRKRLIDEARP